MLVLIAQQSVVHPVETVGFQCTDARASTVARIRLNVELWRFVLVSPSTVHRRGLYENSSQP